MAVILLVKTADNDTIEVPLFGKVTLGRSGTCDFKVEDTKISGRHCSIELTKKGEILVKDLGSTNGTYVNNSKISHSTFRLNDTVLMGTTVIVIDERRLSTLEKKAIGITIKKNKSEPKDLPETTSNSPAQNKDSIPPKDTGPKLEGEETVMKKKISLNKALKNKAHAIPDFSINDSVLEQEASSGLTKLLQLEKSKKGKK